MSKNRTAPRALPCRARERPIPAEMILKVPQKKESPIPAIGPMRPTFTLLMMSLSNSLFWLASLSMAAATPVISVTIWGVVLKMAMCRFRASAWSSFLL